MTSWMHIDTGIVPGGTPLHLMQRGREFSIVADTIELMNSTRGASEEALAILACGRVRGRGAARVLIGGLGMGFTLRAALRNLEPEARVTVAELVPTVAAWARGPLAGVFAGCLDDARVDLRETDVGHLIQPGSAAWDAILLDVDNGPEGFVRPENDRLYGSPGLALARRALRPGGVLGVWSATPDRKFKARLQRAGFVVEEVRPTRTGTAARGTWCGSRPSGQQPDHSASPHGCERVAAVTAAPRQRAYVFRPLSFARPPSHTAGIAGWARCQAPAAEGRVPPPAEP